MLTDNYPEPHKKPLSSTVPTIIENSDGSFHLAIGGSGGSIIFGAVFQVFLNLQHWGMNIGEAIESGRLHDQLYPETTLVDDTYPKDLTEDLMLRGHNLTGTFQATPFQAPGLTLPCSSGRESRCGCY